MAELRVPTIDFSPLGNLGNVYREGETNRLRQQTLAALGQGGAADVQTLLQSGDLPLAQLGINMQNRQSDTDRQARQDAFQREESARAQRNSDRSFGLQARSQGRLESAAEEGSPSGRAKTATQYGIEPGTPEFKTFVLNGQLPTQNTTVSAQVDQRKKEALALGITPDNPMFNTYVLTGKTPREDAQPLTATDKKAILEADEGVLSARTAIGSLDRATKLSEQAFEGPMASKRGYAASFLGSSSDLGKAGIATSQLDNEVTSNALSQLKAIFGGAPTEGERKILLDIQGASSQPHEVRKEIFQRAKNAADARLKFNEQRANELRGGQFYKPQGSMTRAPVQQTQGITQQQYEALPSGSTFTAPDGTQRVKP